jgi:hypothetical protein
MLKETELRRHFLQAEDEDRREKTDIFMNTADMRRKRGAKRGRREFLCLRSALPLVTPC